MRFKTISTLGISSSIIFIVIIAYFMIHLSNQHIKLIEKGMVLENINSGLQELNALSSEFLLYNNERSKVQWLSRNQSLKNIVSRQKDNLSNTNRLFFDKSLTKSLKVFHQLTRIKLQQEENNSLINQYQKQALSAQQQLIIGSMLSTARKILKQHNIYISKLINQIRWLTYALLVGLIVLVYSIWFVLSVQILKPLNSFSEQIRIFSKDMSQRLSYQKNNELGELAQTFNYMADKLVETIDVRDKMTFQAQHDVLTNLPNRLLLMDRLNQSIKRSERDADNIAVLFIDLDKFKEINDSLGHKVGDEVLIQVAGRLHTCMRETDNVSRFGGDEFIVILDSIKHKDSIDVIIKQILDTLMLPMVVMEHTLTITLSVGVSIYPNDATDAEQLIRHADNAMYKAKEKGCNNYQYYNC
jgi:diguanylate cyclase (GGDEF)-like protein